MKDSFDPFLGLKIAGDNAQRSQEFFDLIKSMEDLISKMALSNQLILQELKKLVSILEKKQPE